MKRNLPRIARLIALQNRDKDAIVNVERGRRYSFWEYHLLTNRIADAMRNQLAVTKGDLVYLILNNDNLAIMRTALPFKIDCVFSLTNILDSVEDHRRQIEMIEPQLVFIETKLIESHAAFLIARGCTVVVMDPLSAEDKVRFPELRDFWEMVDVASDAEYDFEVDDQETGLLRFTGGTTGKGKCAIYTHEILILTVDAVFLNPELGMDGSARILHVSPLSHGTAVLIHPTFFGGGANITMNKLDLETMLEVIVLEQVSHLFLVPTILYRLLELQRASPRDLSTVRTVLYGAAPMSPARLKELIDQFGPIFVQAYASTEAPAIISTLGKQDHLIETEEQAKRLKSTGVITPGYEVWITDDKGNELPPGEVGEIRIRSRIIIPGYYNNPEGTAAEFVDGAWRSGDVGYLDDHGYLYIVDRLKDVIISGGFNVYAVEVEAALCTHPDVFNAAVVGVPHEDWGEAVHAEVILRDGRTCSSKELMAHVKERLGSYKAPKSVALVDSLPLTTVGKVRRRDVRKKYWGGEGRQVA